MNLFSTSSFVVAAEEAAPTFVVSLVAAQVTGFVAAQAMMVAGGMEASAYANSATQAAMRAEWNALNAWQRACRRGLGLPQVSFDLRDTIGGGWIVERPSWGFVLMSDPTFHDDVTGESCTKCKVVVDTDYIDEFVRDLPFTFMACRGCRDLGYRQAGHSLCGRAACAHGGDACPHPITVHDGEMLMCNILAEGYNLV